MVVIYKRQFGALCLAVALGMPFSAHADNASTTPQISVINLQVVKNERGEQNVITPKGDLAPLPGAGVNGGVAQIFFGSQGGFWYTDQTGQTIDLSPTVQELQARRAQQVPQYAPVAPPQTYENSTQTQSSRGSGVATAVTTAAAAAGGAMMGSAMTHNYYNAPYGTPMHYGNGQPYYYHDGERREFEELNQNQKMVIYNKRKLEDQQKQDAFKQAQTNRQTNMESRQSQFGGQGHEQNFQKQQEWYQNQLKENSHQWKKTAENPFASQQFSRDGFSRGERTERAGRGERAGREARQTGGARFGGGERGGGGLRGGGGGRRGR